MKVVKYPVLLLKLIESVDWFIWLGAPWHSGLMSYRLVMGAPSSHSRWFISLNSSGDRLPSRSQRSNKSPFFSTREEQAAYSA